MPAVPFIAIALGASGALAAGGAAIASAIGLGTVSAAAATAIGAGAFSAAATAVQGGKASDVLKSAVIGGVTSFAGSAIAGSIGEAVRADAILSGTDAGIANAMGKVIGGAAAGAISSGTSALLSGRDPVDALLKGGLTAAMSTGIGVGVDALLKDVPGFSAPANNTEAAIQRAVRAAIGTTIASGGNADAIGMSVLNSFASTAGQLIGAKLNDSSPQLRTANQRFTADETAYRENLSQQEKLVNDYNAKVQDLKPQYDNIQNLISEYDRLAGGYNNYDSYMRNQGYTLIGGGYDWEGNPAESYYAKQVYQPERQMSGYDADGYLVSWTQPAGYEWQRASSSEDRQALYDRAKAIDAQATAAANEYNERVKVLDPIKQQLDALKAQIDPLGKKLVESKTNLETAVANFNQAEASNAALVKTQLDNFTAARDQYKQEFGVDLTEDQLKEFARTGDILGTVSKLVADNNNEQVANAAGFESYADYTAAGNISPNDYYAKQQGWQDYAQKLNAVASGYNDPNQWNTYINNQQAATSAGFLSYEDYQSAGETTANDFYAKKDGWGSYAEKQQAEDSGFRNPTAWNTHVVEVKNQDAAKAAGFPDYATQQQYGNDFSAYTLAQNNAKAVEAGFPDFETQTRFGNDINEYKAVQEGWQSLGAKQAAAQYEITSPEKYQEFISGKTEEDKVVQMLQERGIPATPERVADIMKSWDFNPTTPNVGFGQALDASDKINIANSRADSVQEAAALAKSLGYSNFTFGGSQYKLNTTAPTQNPYDFFASFGEAYKAARADLGAGQKFEWTNPTTGETKTFSTNNENEQAVADQKRIYMMPAYTGEGAYTRTGNPGVVDNVYFDKSTGNIVQDNRVWDSDGKLVSGEVKNINPNASGSTAERLAASLKESFGKTFDAFKYVTSGINKGGWELLNQLGVLGGMTGLVSMDNWATKTAAEMKAVIDGYQNKEFLNNRALMNAAIAKAGNEGIFAQAVEAGKQFGLNPLQTAEFIAQQGASLFLGGGAMATARALGAGLTAQQAASIGTMAAAQGASVADQAYRDGLKNNKTPEEALNAARVAWAGAALTSAVANRFIPGALSNEAAIASQSIAKASLSSALKGEMSAELAENTSGQIIANLAAGNAWDKDLGSTVVQSVIGSGVVTGLVQVATTGNPETAIEIAKDAGVTDRQLDEIKNSFSGAIGTQNFTVPQAKQQLDEVLSASNLNPEVVSQISDLIGTEAVKEAVSTNLEKAGVPAEYVEMLANLTAPQIYNNDDLTPTFGNVSTALQAAGFNPLDANLITNQTLTGTDVKQVVADQLKAQGYKPTQAELDSLVSQNATALPDAITSSVSEYTGPLTVTKDEARESLIAAGVTNPSQSQIDSLVGQYDQALLQSKAIASASGLSNLISGLEKQTSEGISGVQTQLGVVESTLAQKIADNEASGMARDQAIEKAVSEVAQSVGQSKTDLLALIGRTQENLTQQYASGQLQLEGKLSTLDAASQQRYQALSEDQKLQAAQMAQQGKDLTQAINDVSVASQQQITGVESKLSAAIEAAKQSGLQGDAALQSAINTVAGDLGTTKEALLSQIGTTEAGLRQEFANQIGGVQTQIGDVKSSLEQAIKDAQASGLQGDQALQSAIDSVASNLGTTKDALLAQIGSSESQLRSEMQAGQALTASQIAGLESQLTEQGRSLVAQLQQQGVSYQQALSDAIAAQNAQITAGQEQTAQQIASVKDSLTAQITANEAAGLSRDEATTKAINDLSSQMGVDKASLLTQLGTTEQALRSELQSGLEGVTKTFQDQYNALSATQKAQFDAMVEQGASTQAALAQVQAGLQEQITSGQQQTAEQIQATKDSLSAQIAANEAAGLTRDEATTKAIGDLSTQMGVDRQTLLNQLGTTEQGLRQELTAGLSGLSEAMQAQYSALNAAQKAQFDAMVQQGTDINAAMAQVQAGLQQQIGELSQTQSQQYNQLSQGQKDLYSQLVAQGATQSDALNTAVANLSQDFQNKLAASDAATQAAFGQMTAAQQAEAQARVQQGQDLQAAITASQQATQQQITGGLEALSQDFQGKLAASDAATQAAFAQMTTAQQAETQARVQQGQDLQSAISASSELAAQQLAQTQAALEGQLSAQGKQFFDALRQQGLDYGTALQQAVAAQNEQIAAGQRDLSGQIGALGQATQQQYANLTAAQQKEVADRVAQGESLQNAIAASQQATQEQISAAQRQALEQYNSLSAAQKAETDARVAQGQSLQSAISDVQSGLTQQITQQGQQTQQQISALSQQTQDQYRALTTAQQAEVNARVAQGQSFDAAIAGVGGQLSSLQLELEAQKAADEAYKQQQAQKAAADAAKAAETARRSSQTGILSGLAGLGAAAAATAEEAYKPLQPRFLTSKGGDTKFKGLLEEFQQEVEGAPNMQDNTGNRQEGSDMSPYYSYGSETSLDQILGQGDNQDFSQKFARGGLATPLMAGGGMAGTRYGRYATGGMASPLMAAGGKMRVDFRRGDAVTGPGDGQSDDIPAMLADGEFVFPADVVAALGNGSTKAGSDKLYDMMHSIRAHVRSAKPKDLPPEIKSPLDFLKTSKTRKKRSA